MKSQSAQVKTLRAAGFRRVDRAAGAIRCPRCLRAVGEALEHDDGRLALVVTRPIDKRTQAAWRAVDGDTPDRWVTDLVVYLREGGSITQDQFDELRGRYSAPSAFDPIALATLRTLRFDTDPVLCTKCGNSVDLDAIAADWRSDIPPRVAPD